LDLLYQTFRSPDLFVGGGSEGGVGSQCGPCVIHGINQAPQLQEDERHVETCSSSLQRLANDLELLNGFPVVSHRISKALSGKEG
jgi:hypothetical protein